MMYLGDYKEDDTVHFLWSTNGSDGESITRSTNGTVSVYKDNGTSQTTTGVTDVEDFDSLTGIHACTIDLSSDAFYAVGADYAVVLSAATIDTQTVNAVLAHFSIENRFNETTVTSIATGVVTADAIAADAIGASEIATGAITSAEIAADAIGASEIAASAIGASEIATDAIGADELAAGGIDEMMDEVFEGAYTFRQMMRIVFSGLAGKASGGGTGTLVFRDAADAKARITATVDANGNRTAIVLDGS